MSNLSPDQFYGQGVESLFPEGSSPVRPAPWPRANRYKDVQDYDPDVVKETLQSPAELTEVDPRKLRATQPNITEPGVRYYAEQDDYDTTGTTYADPHNVGNQFPLVYHRPPRFEGMYSEDVLLSGHHRAATALAKGEPLRARKVDGPWGPPRGKPQR